MAYTPELSMKASQTLRRIAWGMDKPMTKTLEFVVLSITMFIEPQKICSKCRDKSICRECIFSDHNHKSCDQVFQ